MTDADPVPANPLSLYNRVVVRSVIDLRADCRWEGELLDIASVPAPHVFLDDATRGPVVIFLGPGITIERSAEHPAL